MYYMNLFFIYAILGYVFEEVTMSLLRKPYNSSVLYGPWTPVYGIAVLIMVFVYIFIRKFKLKKKKEIVCYFILITIILTVLEGISGYIIELTQNKVYWNYYPLKLNMGHYMALEISLIWGIGATFITYFLIPRFKDKIKKIPKKVTWIVFSLFLLDICISFFL